MRQNQRAQKRKRSVYNAPKPARATGRFEQIKKPDIKPGFKNETTNAAYSSAGVSHLKETTLKRLPKGDSGATMSSAGLTGSEDR